MSDSIINLPEEKRDLVWEKLDEIVRRHRKFSDTNWALPEEELCKIENLAHSLAPSSPEIKYRYLFKFVIKAKGKEEEVIFQPGILNIKLIGGKNIK